MTNKIKDAEIVQVEKKEIIASDTTPQSMIMQAIEKGASIETMERLFNLQERWEANMAKKAFDQAMTEFQMKCPIISKNKKGQNAPYASLDHIIGTVKNLLSECGFSYRIESDMTIEEATATCFAIHKEGHTEKSSFKGKIESIISKSGNNVRSSVQDSAAALTYAKRIAFCNAFGIMTGETDNDGDVVKTAPTETAPSLIAIRQLIKDAGMTEGKLAEKFNFPCLDDFDNRSLKILEKSLKEKLAK